MSTSDHMLIWTSFKSAGAMPCSLKKAIEEAKIKEAKGWTVEIRDKYDRVIEWKKQGGENGNRIG